MKAKYYPHVTVCGAAMLFVAPLCFVLLLPYLRGPADFEDAAFADSVIDAAIADEDSVFVAAAEEPAGSVDFGHVPDVTPAAEPPSLVEAPTRMAMRPTDNSLAPAEYTHPTPVAPIDDAAAVIDMASIASSPSAMESDVPIPRQMKSQLPETPAMDAIASEPATEVASVASAKSDAEEFVEPKVDAKTYFDATSHLAMRDGGLGSGGTGTSMNGNTRVATNDRVADRRSSAKMTQADRRKLASDARSAGGLMADVIPKEGTFGESPVAIEEEVILQQPLESRMVSRMENVVAVTRAQGWPVALVKSDLPDDQWWVQQMVGIRGNAFAARVNFGNERSIRGSVYHLVFVFLDSPDEVRRFRIAKQFKELPEGVRRSREYTFTRK